MFDLPILQIAHGLVRLLLVPTIGALLALVALALWEIGQTLGERFGGLAHHRARGDLDGFAAYGRRRIERADMLARIAPMLGLMGTLIPLGPGIAALSRGQFEVLAAAVSVAFDTTVIGLAVGIVGFVIARLRRRWYDAVHAALEDHAAEGSRGTQ